MLGENGRTRTALYLTISFGWTWALWLGGWALGQARQAPIDTGGTLFDLATMAGSPAFLPQLMFDVAVFGPLLGYLAARRYRPVWGRPTLETVLIAVAVPTLSVLPAIALTLATGVPAAGLAAGAAAGAIAVYFVSNLLTSGTEEFGWRGYLHPELRRHERTFWGAAWKGGLIWAVWHYPLMIMLYWQLGLVMILTIVGFTASIVAMAWITGLVYERSNSIALAAVLHALNNTASFALVLLFPTTPFTIVTAAMMWVVVAILERRYRVDKVPASG
jgi:membrane protease YdiL (CAAX protease family)